MIELSTLFTSPGDTGDDPLLQESHLNILPVDSDHGDQLHGEPMASPLISMSENEFLRQLEQRMYYGDGELGAFARSMAQDVWTSSHEGREILRIIEQYAHKDNHGLGNELRQFLH